MNPVVSDLLLMSGIVLVLGKLVPGIRLESAVSAVLVGWVLGLAGPFFLTAFSGAGLAPGLAYVGTFLINCILVLLLSSLIPGFRVDHLRAAFFFYLAATCLHLALAPLLAI